jgi:hypothetical protein
MIMRRNLWIATFLTLPAAAWAQESALPLSLQDPAPAGAPSEPGGFLDLGRFQAGLWAGVTLASGDFESSAQFAGGITLRAPSPWLSRDVLGLQADDLGLFVQVGASRIDRDVAPAPPNPDGTLLTFAFGLDYTFARDEAGFVSVQVGGQYVRFDDVFEADDGLGFLLGAFGGACLSDGIWLTLNPQISVGGDREFLYTFGVGLLFTF